MSPYNRPRLIRLARFGYIPSTRTELLPPRLGYIPIPPHIAAPGAKHLSLCSIVRLLSNKGEFNGEDVRSAIQDYRTKHRNDNLTAMTEEVYRPILKTPGNTVAYWLKRVNPNAIKIASFGLEKNVSEGVEESLEAAVTISENVLKLYEESIADLRKQFHTSRGKTANEKAEKLYILIKDSFTKNTEYIRNVLGNLITSDIAYKIEQIEKKRV